MVLSLAVLSSILDLSSSRF